MSTGTNSPEKLSEREYARVLSEWFFRRTGHPLDLRNPKTFNEKIQWLKLYDSTPLKTMTTDKYLVRDWVRGKIGDKYLIPTLAVYDSFDEINFDGLPSAFVLKTNHGSGWNCVVRDKKTIDFAKLKKTFDKWMSSNYAYQLGFELQYKNIKPKIIVEKYIENYSGNLFDWKIWCFNGKPKYIQFRNDWKADLKMCFFDTKWHKQCFCYDHDLYEDDIPKPDNLDEMLRIAKVLAKGFYHVCVDLYRLDDGKIYFGEMTYTRSSGIAHWQPEEWNLKLGKLIKLPVSRRSIMEKFSYILPESKRTIRYRYWHYVMLSMVTFKEKHRYYVQKKEEYKRKLAGN